MSNILPEDETKNNITNPAILSEKECELLVSQIYVLSDKIVHHAVVSKILLLYPKLMKSFSLISDCDGQAAFILKMVKKGYLEVGYKRSYDNLMKIIIRHINHGVSEEIIHNSLKVILDAVLIALREGLYWTKETAAWSKSAWIKANDVLNDITHKAYSTSTKDIKMKVKQKQIHRLMSVDDINNVYKTWNEIIIEHKDKISMLLTEKIQHENNIYEIFWQNDTNVSEQSLNIINMLDKAITLLKNNNHEELVPYLTSIGIIHSKYNIKPYLMVLMKNIILELVKTVLSFNYTREIKESYKKVFTFIVGIILNKLGACERETSVSSGYSESFDAYDIETLHSKLTRSVINNCKLSWKYIENDMTYASEVFYNSLNGSTNSEIKKLFSSVNMRVQTKRLLKAIGATVYLLNDMETLKPILLELGRRHVYYNVKPMHFKMMKELWFDMLLKVLSKTWNGQLLQTMTSAWNLAWSFIVHYMKISLEDVLLSYISAEPIAVKFKVLINHIDKINVNNSSFYGDIWYSAWTGSNKSHISQSESLDNTVDEIPQCLNINCLNVMQTINDNIEKKSIRYFEEDDSYYLQSNITGTYSNTFDLKTFPFNKHNIEILFAFECDDTITKFDAKQLSVRLMKFKLDQMGGNDYNVYEPKINLIELSGIKGGSVSGKRYTHCKITIPISHKYLYYIYNVILPIIGIEIIQFTIYFVELEPISSPLIIILLLWLTLFGFHKYINYSLPPKIYYTFLDYVFNCAHLLSIYHLCAVYIIYQLHNNNVTITNDNNNKCIVTHNSIIGIGLLLFLITNAILYFRAKYFISLYPKQNQLDVEGKKALDIIAKTTNLDVASPIHSNTES